MCVCCWFHFGRTFDPAHIVIAVPKSVCVRRTIRFLHRFLSSVGYLSAVCMRQRYYTLQVGTPIGASITSLRVLQRATSKRQWAANLWAFLIYFCISVTMGIVAVWWTRRKNENLILFYGASLNIGDDDQGNQHFNTNKPVNTRDWPKINETVEIVKKHVPNNVSENSEGAEKHQLQDRKKLALKRRNSKCIENSKTEKLLNRLFSVNVVKMVPVVLILLIALSVDSARSENFLQYRLHQYQRHQREERDQQQQQQQYQAPHSANVTDIDYSSYYYEYVPLFEFWHLSTRVGLRKPRTKYSNVFKSQLFRWLIRRRCGKRWDSSRTEELQFYWKWIRMEKLERSLRKRNHFPCAFASSAAYGLHQPTS